jgi:hypothetical protein
MTEFDADRWVVQAKIAHMRLANQQIAGSALNDPVEVVRCLGAVQAQDFGAAKWAVGLRLPNADDASIEQAFNLGRILRTHVMRPTWHFVTPDDIRWMIDLTGPRVNKTLGPRYRRLGLDEEIFRKSREVMERELRDQALLTRDELVRGFLRSGINTDNLGIAHLLMRAELDGLICSGPRKGKQFTYALLDERAPGASRMSRDDALAELTRRYFTSHGPATIKDFVWWSGLKVRDAQAGLNLVGNELMREQFDGAQYWFTDGCAIERADANAVHLLPNFDEFIVGYTDRSAYWHESHEDADISRSNSLFNHTVIVDGRIAGTWTRTIKKTSVDVSVNLFHPLDEQVAAGLRDSLDRYGGFVGLPINRL